MQPAADLNTPQLQAVTAGDGPLLVFAGAGSGKTRVITYRIAHLVADRGVPAWRILAVTFTNKAAGEMRERVFRRLGDAAKGLWLGTFHALCARMLRKHAADAGLPEAFAIYDETDQKSLVTRVLRDMGIDDRRITPRTMLNAISKEKQEDRGPEEAIRPKRSDLYDVPEVYAEYEKRKAAAGALDFDDLLFRTVRLLRDKTEILDGYRERFLHVLVDEFQDTNGLQYTFLRQIAAKHRAITVVGDDDQSIYSWRGADPRNIKRFRDDFPGTKVIKLEQNYRSTGKILEAATGVIARNHTREPKTLWTAGEAGAPVERSCLLDERSEALAVVAAIERAKKDGLRLADVAIFYRIHAMSRVLEEALRIAKIPYVVVGGQRFYERAEVKDVLAYLRVLSNPDDGVSLERIVNQPPRGIGKTTVEALAAHAKGSGASLFETMRQAAAGGVPGLASRARSALADFCRLFDDLRSLGAKSPATLAQEVIERTGYEKALIAEDSVQADSRIENLRELVGSMALAEAEDPELDLVRFLEQVSLASALDDVKDQDRVVLMTVHSAKGLEFRRVIVVALEDGLFPYAGADAVAGYIDPDKEEEERRLCYVAMTRAREKLLLLHTTQRILFGRSFMNGPSRFLGEIPEGAVIDVGRSRPRAASIPAPRARRTETEIDYSYSQVVPDEYAPFPVGTRVRHKTFGRGKVLRCESGSDPKVEVQFEDFGKKKLVARVLEPA